MLALYPHQQRVFDLIMGGQNVILQAPTGSGKTRAALYPFLYSLTEAQNSPFKDCLPTKCIYSVPMRVLAKQFYDEYEKTLAAMNRKFASDYTVHMQTGDQPHDSEFASNLIFATIDQTLSSYLNAPYSLSRGRANLNAGAVMSAYLIFDEFHLYDPSSTLPTTLQMLKDLRGIAPFILMTATFSSDMLGGLAKALDATVVPNTDEERTWFTTLESQKKQRHYHIAEQSLNAKTILEHHKAIPSQRKRSLVICNVVDRARAMAQALIDSVDDDTDIILLHSRFLPEDRDAKEQFIKQRFGKDDTSAGSLIVVATQAIEVGVDMSSHVLHTELAPANAILQRAGRCARYKGNQGDVYIYQHVESPDGTLDLCENPAPYTAQGDLFPVTQDAFARFNGQHLNFDAEQDIITQVHGKADQNILIMLRASEGSHIKQMQAVMRACDKSQAKGLIRDMQSQRVTVHAEPEKLCIDPYQVPAFSLHPGTLKKAIQAWLEAYHGRDDIAWAVQIIRTDDDEEREAGTQTRYYAEPIWHAEDVQGAPLVVVHPALATYSSKVGFILMREDGPAWQAPLPEKKQMQRSRVGSGYLLETYETHIRYVDDAFKAFWPELAWAANRLEARYGWATGSVERAAQLAVWLHDIGKLNRDWQAWAADYQKRIDHPTEPESAYAHTQFNWSDALHKDAERAARPHRPRHALESAIASLPIVAAEFGHQDHPLVAAVFSAIARHHSPDANTLLSDFILRDDALRHIYAVADNLPHVEDIPGLKTRMSIPFGRELIAHLIADPSDEAKPALRGRFSAYRLIVRALRRADSVGTKNGAMGVRRG